MHLRKIILHDFKNVADATLEFTGGINCISGDNGAGKTNLLDAVYYLSMTKSYFSASDQYVIRHGAEEAIATGFYEMDDGFEERIAVSVRKGGKTMQRGGKTYERLSDHIGLIPIVMVSPADSVLINEGGEDRRKYLNFILSQTDRQYLSHIQAYNRLLLHRNKLLRDDLHDNSLLLETIDEQMAPHAAYIHQARKNICQELQPLAQGFYSKISSGAEEVSLTFRSQLDETDFQDLMARNAEKDRVLGFTYGGVQRDETGFYIDGYPLRKCGSQGQQKTFLLALKLAQMKFMREACKLTPILLLDDVFDKLDMRRVESLLALVADSDFGQIFLSDSNKVRVSGIVDAFKSDTRCFYVSNGAYSVL